MNPFQLSSSLASQRIPESEEEDSEDVPFQSAGRLGSSMSYGSPSTMEYGFSSSNAKSPLPTTPERPRRGVRSVSSPAVPRRRMDTSPSRRSHVEPQWTLFGQLMENEGQLSARPRSTASFRRPSNASNFSRPQGLGDFGTSAEAALQPGSTFSSPRPTLERQLSQETFVGNAPDYDSADSESTTSVELTPKDGSFWFPFAWLPTLTVAHRNILKCAIAYFIASLFTFSPHLSGLFSGLISYGPGHHDPLPSGHMVATIAVYFNPAKTVGSMIEADLFCFLGLVYAAFICLGSMAMYWWVEEQEGWEWLADIIVLHWVGIGMAVIAFMKVWMSNPSFNTACSMMSIIVFVVIVKEGGLLILGQVTAIVVCGSVIANLVCFFIWPQSATITLQDNMVKTLDSFSTLLSKLTEVFLVEDQDDDEHHKISKLHQAIENHQNSFTTLKKILGEAQSEWIYRDFDVDEDDGSKGGSILRGEYASHRGYEDAVDSMNRLAQHLNGLRSSTRLQHELTKADIIREHGSPSKGKAIADDESAILHAAAEMFGDLIDELGPPLKSLTGACTSTIDKLKVAFTKARSKSVQPHDIMQPEDFIEMAEGIERALFAFESTSNHALLRLYRRGAHPISRENGSWDSENKLLTEDENEHVFLVYFFIFTLQEFAGEVILLADAMERIYNFERRRMMQDSFFRRLGYSIVRRFTLIRLWLKRPTGQVQGLHRSLSYMIPQHRVAHAFFPKIRPHAPDTIQTPSRKQLSFWGRVKHRVWELSGVFKERNVKYAIKAGIAIALLASPAFFDVTRPYFVEYQGDWALVSTFVVLSPTIGATNYLSFQRILGTLFGALVAACIYSLFPEDAVVLSVFGFFFSLPCFYYAVTRPHLLSASRFVLLTYNLTCLYCYNLRQRDVWVWDIAIDRAMAVIGGVLWAAIVSRLWWPAEARAELSKSLGDFCINLGWLYTRLVASNSFAPDYQPEAQQYVATESSRPLAGSSNLQVSKLHNSIHEFMAMELHLQIKLIDLQNLLAQAQHEPRLKGPFPVALYRDVLTSLQTILDKLHSMRCVTTREEWYTSVRKDFIVPVNKERHEMVGNIILSFSTLASAFRLKAPLPPYLPPAEKSRQRLVAAIKRLDVVKNRDIRGSRQLLFFAYAITMRGVTEELERLGRTLQEAFGVIGGASETFDALFFQEEERYRIIEHAS
ncbi:hypothetical protein FA15DRAFT_672991 [Coprinopsis marcescibilis]|uniref:Uncharacterized protein n=1 Tax=Coprinopsis marcescibilis TaxID=230819 RepID=A0A5C3KLB4_COPMA|nr:hypothetical protein FA15DRAFT_672991 [Coprinopsis marcescibilis]